MENVNSKELVLSIAICVTLVVGLPCQAVPHRFFTCGYLFLPGTRETASWLNIGSVNRNRCIPYDNQNLHATPRAWHPYPSLLNQLSLHSQSVQCAIRICQKLPRLSIFDQSAIIEECNAKNFGNYYSSPFLSILKFLTCHNPSQSPVDERLW